MLEYLLGETVTKNLKNITDGHNIMHLPDIAENALSLPLDTVLDKYSPAKEITHRIVNQAGGTRFMFWSPDLQYIYIIGRQGPIIQWERQRRQSLQVFGDYQYVIKHALATNDGRLITFGEKDDSYLTRYHLKIRDAASGDIQAIYDLPALNAMAITQDNKYLILAVKNECQIMEISTGKIKHSFIGHIKYINSLCVYNDNLYTCSNDPAIWIFSLSSGKHIGTLDSHKYPVRRLNTTRDGAFMVSGSLENIWNTTNSKGEIKTWNSETGQCIQSIHCTNEWYQELSETDSPVIITVGKGGTGFLRNLITGKIEDRFYHPLENDYELRDSSKRRILVTDKELIFTDSKNIIMHDREQKKECHNKQVSLNDWVKLYLIKKTGHHDCLSLYETNTKTLAFYDTCNGRLKQRHTLNQDLKTYVMSPNAYWLTYDYQDNLCVWTIETDKAQCLASQYFQGNSWPSITVQGNLAAVISDKLLYLYSLPELGLITTLDWESYHSFQTLSLCISKDIIIRVGYRDKEHRDILVTIWDPHSRSIDQEWIERSDIDSVVTQEDGSIVSLDKDTNLHLINRYKHIHRILALHSYTTASYYRYTWLPLEMSLIPEYQAVIVMDTQKQLTRSLLIDLKSMQVKRMFGGSNYFIRSCYLSSDNARLIGYCSDGRIRFWDFFSGKLLGYMHCLDEGFLYTTPPDKYFPSGLFWTDRPDLISVYEKTEGIQPVDYLSHDDARFKEYMLVNNRPDMVLARLRGLKEYERLAKQHKGIVNNVHSKNHKNLYTAVKRALPGH